MLTIASRRGAPLFVLLVSILGGCAAQELESPAPAPPPAKAPPAPAAPAVPDLSKYKLGVGDKIRIEVYGEPDLSLDAQVDPGGRVNYPLLGSLVALHKTAKEFQDELAATLSKGYLVKPDVRVSVIGYRAFYAIGQVRRPGAYGYSAGLTVEKALALAGGMTALASQRKIFILREGQPVEKRTRATLDTLVFPGDTLMVEEGLF